MSKEIREKYLHAYCDKCDNSFLLVWWKGEEPPDVKCVFCGAKTDRIWFSRSRIFIEREHEKVRET